MWRWISTSGKERCAARLVSFIHLPMLTMLPTRRATGEDRKLQGSDWRVAAGAARNSSHCWLSSPYTLRGLDKIGSCSLITSMITFGRDYVETRDPIV